MIAKGSIPACAGEPTDSDPAFNLRIFWGLSPRVRGNLNAEQAFAEISPSTDVTVYPRVCGGTRKRPGCSWPPTGLSPRVRGNPSSFLRGGRMRRSIPACAGEPPSALSRAECHAVEVYPRVCGGTSLLRHQPNGRWSEVYPRVCGGTLSRPDTAITRRGLSPRVRGNLPPAWDWWPSPGSIPACAGEPDTPPP